MKISEIIKAIEKPENRKKLEEMNFNGSIHLMIAGLIERDHDLEDIVGYLKFLAEDYQKMLDEIYGEAENTQSK